MWVTIRALKCLKTCRYLWGNFYLYKCLRHLCRYLLVPPIMDGGDSLKACHTHRCHLHMHLQVPCAMPYCHMKKDADGNEIKDRYLFDCKEQSACMFKTSGSEYAFEKGYNLWVIFGIYFKIYGIILGELLDISGCMLSWQMSLVCSDSIYRLVITLIFLAGSLVCSGKYFSCLVFNFTFLLCRILSLKGSVGTLTDLRSGNSMSKGVYVQHPTHWPLGNLSLS